MDATQYETVGELIDALARYPRDTPIIVHYDAGVSAPDLTEERDEKDPTRLVAILIGFYTPGPARPLVRPVVK